MLEHIQDWDCAVFSSLSLILLLPFFFIVPPLSLQHAQCHLLVVVCAAFLEWADAVTMNIYIYIPLIFLFKNSNSIETQLEGSLT